MVTKRAPAKKPAAKSTRKTTKKKAAPPPSPPRFGPRGERLWSAHRSQVKGERGLVMLDEACRIADRLDQLHALLKGETRLWCRLVELVEGGGVFDVRIDAALIEARQQANVLRQILTSLPIEGGDDEEDRDAWIDKL